MEGSVDLSELAKALLTQDLSSLEGMIRAAAEAAVVGLMRLPSRAGARGRSRFDRLKS